MNDERVYMNVDLFMKETKAEAISRLLKLISKIYERFCVEIEEHELKDIEIREGLADDKREYISFVLRGEHKINKRNLKIAITVWYEEPKQEVEK